jgi:hypothetical protein
LPLPHGPGTGTGWIPARGAFCGRTRRCGGWMTATLDPGSGRAMTPRPHGAPCPCTPLWCPSHPPRTAALWPAPRGPAAPSPLALLWALPPAFKPSCSSHPGPRGRRPRLCSGRGAPRCGRGDSATTVCWCPVAAAAAAVGLGPATQAMAPETTLPLAVVPVAALHGSHPRRPGCACPPPPPPCAFSPPCSTSCWWRWGRRGAAIPWPCTSRRSWRARPPSAPDPAGAPCGPYVRPGHGPPLVVPSPRGVLACV